MSAPSSSRMLDCTFEAISSSTSGGTPSRSYSHFLRRIAMRVSRSGGWTSVISPHSKRLRSRSSSWAICFGGRSLEMTICFSALCSALKVWKNSSWVRSFCSRNWMSSIRRTSAWRYRRWKPVIRSSRMALMNSLVNCSVVTYRT